MKLAVAVTIFAVCSAVQAAAEEDIADLAHIVTLGTRPYYILDEMKPSDLKEKLRELVYELKYILWYIFPYYMLSSLYNINY